MVLYAFYFGAENREVRGRRPASQYLYARNLFYYVRMLRRGENACSRAYRQGIYRASTRALNVAVLVEAWRGVALAAAMLGVAEQARLMAQSRRRHF